MTPSELAWRAWRQQHPWWESDDHDADIWNTAYALGIREGQRLNAQLGISTLVQQLSVVLERLERLAAELAEHEMDSVS